MMTSSSDSRTDAAGWSIAGVQPASKILECPAGLSKSRGSDRPCRSVSQTRTRGSCTETGSVLSLRNLRVLNTARLCILTCVTTTSLLWCLSSASRMRAMPPVAPVHTCGATQIFRYDGSCLHDRKRPCKHSCALHCSLFAVLIDCMSTTVVDMQSMSMVTEVSDHAGLGCVCAVRLRMPCANAAYTFTRCSNGKRPTNNTILPSSKSCGRD